jgi:hypothetical protein
MLGSLVLHGVGGEVDGTDVVAVDKGAPEKGVMELDQELAEPRGLCHAIGCYSAAPVCSPSSVCSDTMLE